MTDEEMEKAKKFYEFLKELSECKNGQLKFGRDELIPLASSIMKVSPIEAHNILMKMQEYGMITLGDRFIIVNIDWKNGFRCHKS